MLVLCPLNRWIGFGDFVISVRDLPEAVTSGSTQEEARLRQPCDERERNNTDGEEHTASRRHGVAAFELPAIRPTKGPMRTPAGFACEAGAIRREDTVAATHSRACREQPAGGAGASLHG